MLSQISSICLLPRLDTTTFQRALKVFNGTLGANADKPVAEVIDQVTTHTQAQAHAWKAGRIGGAFPPPSAAY